MPIVINISAGDWLIWVQGISAIVQSVGTIAAIAVAVGLFHFEGKRAASERSQDRRFAESQRRHDHSQEVRRRSAERDRARIAANAERARAVRATKMLLIPLFAGLRSALADTDSAIVAVKLNGKEANPIYLFGGNFVGHLESLIPRFERLEDRQCDALLELTSYARNHIELVMAIDANTLSLGFTAASDGQIDAIRKSAAATLDLLQAAERAMGIDNKHKTAPQTPATSSGIAS